MASNQVQFHLESDVFATTNVGALTAGPRYHGVLDVVPAGASQANPQSLMIHLQ